MRKIKIELTAVFLINVLIAAYIPPAYAGKEAAAALSPAININSPFIQNSLSVIAQDPQKLDDCGLGLEELSLAERSRLIVARCENGDYRLLSVDFEKRKFDYQQHIKEVAAINDALNRIIGGKSGLRGFKDKSGFLKAAIATRLSIIENYSAHLSEYGNVMFNQIKSGIAVSGDDELLVALERLCDPSREWFSGMLSDKAAAAIFETSPDIILTWGCSTQCDHCNGASIIRITSFPWPWIEELSRQFEDLSVMLFRNDFFRDYYDPVFHKDAYDVMEKFYITELNTSGFAPGSVAENALKRSKDRFGIVKISIAPSAWMRKIGTEKYIQYLLNVINLAEGARKILGFKVFAFKQESDPENMVWEIIRSPEISEHVLKYLSMELYGRDEVPLKEYLEKKPLPERLAPKLLDIGRYKQLRIEEVLNAVEEGDYIAREDIDRHFLIPDGSIVKGIAPTEKYRFRRYERITPIAAKDRISCWSCDLSCAGKENGNCPGRTEFFKKMGLSESGGFLTASRLPERSV